MNRKTKFNDREFDEERNFTNVTGITEIICGIILREFEYQQYDEIIGKSEEQYNDHCMGLRSVFDRYAGSLNTRPAGRDTEVC